MDVGGTFTDVICVTPAGEVVLDKTPTTLDDQSTGVMNGLGQLAERFDLALTAFCSQLDILVHGTTTADNTMIEMNGARPGCSSPKATATRSSCAAATRSRSGTRRLRARRPSPPARAHPDRRAVDFEGTVLRDTRRRRSAQRRPALEALGVRSIAVMYLFSFVNPAQAIRSR